MPADPHGEEKLGSKFWLMLVGILLAVGVGALLIFWLIGKAWYRWGFLGAMIFVGVLLLAIGYVYDRRQARG
jgi:amino acid transporter